jgi:hypothetical protein
MATTSVRLAVGLLLLSNLIQQGMRNASVFRSDLCIVVMRYDLIELKRTSSYAVK